MLLTQLIGGCFYSGDTHSELDVLDDCLAPQDDSASLDEADDQSSGERRRQLLTAASLPMSWFLSTDAACEPSLAPGAAPVQIGYIATVKGADFLRALRRCVNLATGDRTQYVMNGVSCPAGYAVEAIVGYVR